MYSFLIRIARLVNKAVLDEKIIPALGFNIVIVLEQIVDAEPNKFSVIIKKISLFKFLLSYNSHYQF